MRDSSAAAKIEDVKALVLAHRDRLLADPDFLDLMGLPEPGVVVEFGPFARKAAAHRREAEERSRLEAIARANQAARERTHGAVIELLEAFHAEDLAERLDRLAREAFDLSAAALAVEGEAPPLWRPLAKGQVAMLLPRRRAFRMGVLPTALGLFENRGGEIASIALVRFRLWSGRAGLMALGSADPTGFTAEMNPDLLLFLGRVVERCALKSPG
ncbi:MAG: DUF484 family protein [Caulobacteraceae bacterium]